MKQNYLEKIGIVGLGYVGLPLAVEFGKKYDTVGYDLNSERIAQLERGFDQTKEVDQEQLTQSNFLRFSADSNDLADCNIYIITVPTPIDHFNKPDLSYLLSASKAVGKLLKPGDIVVYESTVYPGCTEEECVPILQKCSGLEFNKDFFCGYSPERINPGDRERTLTKILKIVSGSTPVVAEKLYGLYGSIIEAGIYRAPSIKVAEAAKAIENAQRDINISFVNELALMFDKMDIDTSEVLEAAGTKWNFLKFKPGLVGGHCISVDPYYLVYKSQSLGYHPQVILSGRRINEGMGAFIARKLLKSLIATGTVLHSCRILILGITFKENCPDIRNTKVIDVYRELKEFGLSVDVHDPWAIEGEVFKEYGLELTGKLEEYTYDGIIVAVAHSDFASFPIERYKSKKESIVFDVKSMYEKERVNLRF